MGEKPDDRQELGGCNNTLIMGKGSFKVSFLATRDSHAKGEATSGGICKLGAAFWTHYRGPFYLQ